MLLLPRLKLVVGVHGARMNVITGGHDAALLAPASRNV